MDYQSTAHNYEEFEDHAAGADIDLLVISLCNESVLPDEVVGDRNKAAVEIDKYSDINKSCIILPDIQPVDQVPKLSECNVQSENYVNQVNNDMLSQVLCELKINANDKFNVQYLLVSKRSLSKLLKVCPAPG